MLAGVATRRHALVAEPIGEELEDVARGDSRSAISRRFVAATTEKLAELLASDLSVHDAAVLMIDGIIFAECCCVVALVVTTDGTKIPVGLWEGDTENTTVVKHLLADLVARGLRLRGGSAPRDRRVQGARRRHQARLRQATPSCKVAFSISAAMWLTTCPELARRIDRQLKARLQRRRRRPRAEGGQGPRRPARTRAPGAAASLREGLDDMFTVRRLGASDRLARSLSCTNAVESMISTVRLSARV